MVHNWQTASTKPIFVYDAIRPSEPKTTTDLLRDYLANLASRVAKTFQDLFKWIGDKVYSTGITHAWPNVKVSIVDSLLKKVYLVSSAESKSGVHGGSFLNNKIINEQHDRYLTGFTEPLKRANLTVTQSTITIDSETQLDGIVLKPTVKKSGEAKWILYFLPYQSYWECCADELIQLQKNSGANIACFNYRGTGKSSGQRSTCEQTDIDDGYKIVKEILLNTNIKIRRLALYGKLYGSHVALSVAQKLLDENIKLPTIVERPHNTLKSLYREKFPNFSRIAVPILSMLGWQLDTQKSLGKLKSKVMHFRLKNDPIIPQKASLQKPYDGDEFTGKFSEKSGITPQSAQKKIPDLYPNDY